MIACHANDEVFVWVSFSVLTEHLYKFGYTCVNLLQLLNFDLLVLVVTSIVYCFHMDKSEIILIRILDELFSCSYKFPL